MMGHNFTYSELIDMNMGELLLYNKRINISVEKENREIERQSRKR
jgi:hypothetical protein